MGRRRRGERGPVVTGGERDGSTFAPTVVADVEPGIKIRAEGTVRSRCRGQTAVDSVESAITLATGSCYGFSSRHLSPRDVAGAISSPSEINSGNIHINWTALCAPT